MKTTTYRVGMELSGHWEYYNDVNTLEEAQAAAIRGSRDGSPRRVVKVTIETLATFKNGKEV